jgi:hypothetical protein
MAQPAAICLGFLAAIPSSRDCGAIPIKARRSRLCEPSPVGTKATGAHRHSLDVLRPDALAQRRAPTSHVARRAGANDLEQHVGNTAAHFTELLDRKFNDFGGHSLGFFGRLDDQVQFVHGFAPQWVLGQFDRSDQHVGNAAADVGQLFHRQLDHFGRRGLRRNGLDGFFCDQYELVHGCSPRLKD